MLEPEERCKNCKFSQRIFKSSSVFTCMHDKLVEGGSDSTPVDGLSYIDYEGYSTNIYVGPEFGCIHFEKRRYT